MKILTLVFQFLACIFILRGIIRVYRKSRRFAIERIAEKHIEINENETVEDLERNFMAIGTLIQQHPNVPRLYYFRAIVAAKISTIVADQEIAKKYYDNSSFDLDTWLRTPYKAGGPDTPAMDTLSITSLRRKDGKNPDFMDSFDMIGDIGIMKSIDESSNDFRKASANRHKKLKEDEN